MNLMELFVKIGVDDQASSKVSTITDNMGGGLKTAAKIGVKAIKAASSAIIGLTGLAIKNYAEYEQLAGGAEKIFDEMNPQTILADAQDAYFDMGLSANQYLEVINDVGAAFASTMGDEKGYEAAKTGLQAISDYASGTGKNVDLLSEKFMMITRSTSSYQAIADQFSGILPATSKDFLAQAQAAGLLSDEYTALTEVPIDEYQAAVSEMLKQGVADLGLAGNTAAEAMSTISGSLAATKAAWSNLVTGLVDDNADFDTLMTNFTEIASAAVGNLLPRMGTALKGIGTLIEELMPVIMDEIPTIITDTLPSILESAVNIVTAIGQGLLDNAELILNTAVDLILMLAEGLAQGLPQMVPAIVEVVLKIVDILTQPKTLNSLIDAAIEIIIALAEGLINAIPKLLEYVPKIIVNIAKTLISNLPKILTVGIKILKALWDGINNWSQTLLKKVKDLAKKLPKKISDGIGSLAEKGKTWIKSIWNGINNWASNLKEKVLTLAKKLPAKIKSGIGSLFTVGKNWIQGMWNGIKNKKDWLIQKITGLAKNAKQAIKDFFGIKSPSRVMRDEVGKPIAEGIGVGFMENDPIGQIKDNLNQGLKTIIPTVKMSGAQIDFGGNAGGGVSVVQNIYSQAQTAADLMQEAIYQQEKAVYLGV